MNSAHNLKSIAINGQSYQKMARFYLGFESQ
jgi:hypothetical protein